MAPNRKRSRRVSHGGFTLVELLVVVSIIALLVAILLPSLRTARDQTKRTLCMSNLAQIGKSMISYGIEYDAFPILISEKDGGFSWSTWSFGGWTGKNPFWTQGSGIYHADTNQRPLSVYMYGVKAGLRGCGTATEPHLPPGESTQLPVYRCPADSIELRALYEPTGAGQALHEYNSYDDVGTSYRLNYHWFDQARSQVQAECPECPSDVELYRRVARRGQTFWKRYMLRGAARFVMLAEQPANLGFFRKLQTIGFHRKFSWHNLAFLDGHVDYLEADTRKLSGREWTVQDELTAVDDDLQSP